MPPRSRAQLEQREREFLDAYDASVFARPSVAVDVAILTVLEGRLEVALVRRAEPPHEGKWALPGGFVALDESLEAAATRVLGRKASLRDVFLEQLYTFGAPNRDARTRVISVAHYALVAPEKLRAHAAQAELALGRVDVPWQGESGGPVRVHDPGGNVMPLAFDHAQILGMAVKRLRGKLDYTPIGFQLLPSTFTLRRLQDVHETILGRTLNKDSFRRRMLASGLLRATGEHEGEVGHRPAELYRFTRRSAI
jgi:8-oxo-dGTP diphosphatase